MHINLPTLQDEHVFIMETARNFSKKHLLPEVIERDQEQRFPKEEIAQMAKLGFMGMMVSPKYGGGGMNTVAYVLALIEIAKIDASAAICMSVNNSLLCWAIETYGTEAQKQKYLTPLAKGEILGAFCLSEPESGAESREQHTTGLLKEGLYLINGTKNWVTNGHSASLYLVFAQSDTSKKNEGVSAFLVERNWPGVEVGKREDTMGIRSSETYSVIFSDVRVPKENLLGEEREGLCIAVETLNGGRIGAAAQATGIATGAYERALSYAKTRKVFGRPICELQAIQFKLADMSTKVEAARLLTLGAAHAKDQHKPCVQASSTAKLYASNIAQEVTSEAVQVHGGYGCVKEFHVERMMRDAKIMQLYEGTSEIQRILIAQKILS